MKQQLRNFRPLYILASNLQSQLKSNLHGGNIVASSKLLAWTICSNVAKL